nr:unnamed protein product [Callosobruchus chinensis]
MTSAEGKNYLECLRKNTQKPPTTDNDMDLSQTIDEIVLHTTQALVHQEPEAEHTGVKRKLTPAPMSSTLDDGFQFPKKTCILSGRIKNNNPSTPTPPKPLNKQAKPSEESKNFKLPPIVLAGIVENNQDLIKGLKEKLNGPFYFKYTKHTTLLFLQDSGDYEKVKSELTGTDIEFHTYTPKSEKQHAFIIRGLDNQPNLTEIREELQKTHNLDVFNIYNMKTKGRALYMLVTNNQTTLRYLNANVRFLLNTRIYWERRRNERPVIQCRRCQRHGHATTNCQRQPRCLKCADEHWTNACTKSRDTPAKCVNCLGAHPANYSGCPEYKKKLEVVDEKRLSAKHLLKPAPLPATNPWTQRSAPSVSQNERNTDPNTIHHYLNREGRRTPQQDERLPHTELRMG